VKQHKQNKLQTTGKGRRISTRRRRNKIKNKNKNKRGGGRG
jgi:hypothetical protein